MFCAGYKENTYTVNTFAKQWPNYIKGFIDDFVAERQRGTGNNLFPMYKNIFYDPH